MYKKQINFPDVDAFGKKVVVSHWFKKIFDRAIL